MNIHNLMLQFMKTTPSLIIILLIRSSRQLLGPSLERRKMERSGLEFERFSQYCAKYIDMVEKLKERLCEMMKCFDIVTDKMVLK